MNKFFYVLVLVTFGTLVAGCLSNGKIDWDIFVKPNVEDAQND